MVYYCVVKFRCNYSFNTSSIIPHPRGRLYPRHQNKGKQVNFKGKLHQIRGRLPSPLIFSHNFRGRLQMIRGRCLQPQLLHQIQLENSLPKGDTLPKDMANDNIYDYQWHEIDWMIKLKYARMRGSVGISTIFGIYTYRYNWSLFGFTRTASLIFNSPTGR